MVQVNPSVAQCARQISGVGVDNLAEEDFRTDGDNLRAWHIQEVRIKVTILLLLE